ncbi:MAG: hypothetical protein CMO55_12190 [Verrucomicrobiales bacterium]|nr:hypothetical protein [Verrucomicrobiales bacterium]
MTNQAPPILISLKPNYADLVFTGLKTAELRRRMPSDLENREVFVYVSTPVRALRGGFKIGQVWSGSPEEIWSHVSQLAAVSEDEYEAYFQNANVAYALEILDLWEYQDPPSLTDLRSNLGKFVVPQSYRFVKPVERNYFMELCETEQRLPLRSVA